MDERDPLVGIRILKQSPFTLMILVNKTGIDPGTFKKYIIHTDLFPKFISSSVFAV